VAVFADCDMTSGEQSEENFDPTRSVMVNSQKTEDTSSPGSMAAGVPGTASNLPDPAPRPAASGGGTSRKTESISYQSSRTVKRVVLPQGNIRRLSISVLLDHEVRFEGAGAETKRVLTPPTPERLKVIHDLAAAAVGLNMDRGDQLTVESLPFESTQNLEPPGASPAPAPVKLSPLEALKSDPKLLGGAAAAILVVLLGVGFMVMKMRKSRAAQAEVEATAALPAPAEAAPALENTDVWQPPSLAAAALAAPRALAEQVRETALKDVEVSAGVLRGWLREEA
jgi:flagellar M-ring protein FliF